MIIPSTGLSTNSPYTYPVTLERIKVVSSIGNTNVTITTCTFSGCHDDYIFLEDQFYEFKIAPKTSYKVKAGCPLKVAYFMRHTMWVNITSQFMAMIPEVIHFISSNQTEVGFLIAPETWVSYVSIYVKDVDLKNMLIDGRPFTDHSKFMGEQPPSVYYNGEKWSFRSASFYGSMSKNYVTVSNTNPHAIFATLAYGYINGEYYGHPIPNIKCVY